MYKIQVKREINLADDKPYNLIDEAEANKVLCDLKKIEVEPDLIYAVKVVDETAGERFWCRVTKVDGRNIHATVDNELISSDLKEGDEIIFDIKCVIDVCSTTNTVAAEALCLLKSPPPFIG